MTVEDGKTVAKPETDPAKNGYDFGGWYSGDAEYDFSAAVKSDLTLTAKWTAHAYTITYELNGGTNSSENPDKYTIESEDITLKDPTGPAAAPVFQGWYSDKDFQNRVSPAVIAKGSTGDRTFCAKFGTETLKEFTVTFNVVAEANGTVLGTDSIKVNDGDKISDAQLEAAKSKIASLGEYEYDGLYTDAALAAAFDTSAKITADTTLYVKVKAVQKFTVTFDSDGGSAVAAVTVKSGEKATKPADPAKDGYTFKGWLLGDAEYNFDTPVTGDITLKAKWEEATKSESIISVSPWSLITTKTVLSGYSDKADAKIKFTYLGNEDVAYDCPFLYSASDKDDMYNSKAELASCKVNKITKDGEDSVEYSVAELVTSMGENEYLTYDAWGKISGIKAVVVTYEGKSDSLISVSPWSLITTKTVLSGYSDKADAKIKFTYLGNEDVAYDCPFLYSASDKDDMYNSKAELASCKVNKITKDGEDSVEYSVAELVTSMGENEYLTYDAWGKISGIKAVEISYTK